jgi:hypothetical protein
MSCDHIRIQKHEDKIVFLGEPKMKIETGTSLLYSKYITEKLPSIAYHDEPRFLKIQEFIKLYFGVRWLYNGKKVQANKEWVAMHTSSGVDAQLKLGARNEPPVKMIPRPPVFQPPSSDVEPWVVEMSRSLMKKVEPRYGYLDARSSSMITFKGDGTPYPPEKCWSWSFKFSSNALPVEIRSQCHLPVMLCDPAACKEKLLLSNGVSSDPLSIVTTDSEEKMEFKVTKTIKALQPSHPLALFPLEETMTMSLNNSPPLCSGDPNQVIETVIRGKRRVITPDVTSLDELIDKCTVPIPYMCIESDGIGLPAARGGVSTRNIDVRVEKPVLQAQRTATNKSGNFIGGLDSIGVRAEGIYKIDFLSGSVRYAGGGTEVCPC